MYENLWIKVAVNMFNGPKAKIIDTYEDKRDLIHYVWFRCMTLAGAVNDNGYLYINENMPYTIKTLAIEFNRPLEDVKFAIKILKKLQMLEYTEDKFFKVKNWTKYQNVDALEKIRIDRNNRVAKHRAKIKNEKIQKENIDKSSFENEINKASENNNEENSNISKKDNNKNLNEDNIDNNNSSKDNSSSNLISECESPNGNTNLINNTTCNEDELQSNVTCNNEVTISNVTVTDKIKNKKKTKNKKIEIESEEDNNLIQLKGNNESNKLTDGKTSHSVDISNQNLKEKFDDITAQNKSLEKYEIQSVDPDLSEGTARLSKYHESITGKIGVLESGKLRGAIALHGEANVKMAIDAAIKVDKAEMGYINGILSNWRRKGYPKDDMEVKRNGIRSTGKSNTTDKNEFAGFKPKEPRKLTADERKRIQANLI